MPDLATNSNTEADIAGLEALDVIEAVFAGETARFLSLLPTDVSGLELLLVAVIEQAQHMLEACAPAAVDSSLGTSLWLQMVLNHQRTDACGSDAMAQAQEVAG